MTVAAHLLANRNNSTFSSTQLNSKLTTQNDIVMGICRLCLRVGCLLRPAPSTAPPWQRPMSPWTWTSPPLQLLCLFPPLPLPAWPPLQGSTLGWHPNPLVSLQQHSRYEAEATACTLLLLLCMSVDRHAACFTEIQNLISFFNVLFAPTPSPQPRPLPSLVCGYNSAPWSHQNSAAGMQLLQ